MLRKVNNFQNNRFKLEDHDLFEKRKPTIRCLS